MTVDFRHVYATVIDRWLAGDAAAVLDRKFEPRRSFWRGFKL